MTIDKKQIKLLAELAKIDLLKGEEKILAKQISDILDYVGQVNDINKGVHLDDFSDPVKNINVTREDNVYDNEEERINILKNAPMTEDNLIKTLPVFKDEK